MATKYGTESIGRRALENALHGLRFAREQGRRANVLVTINFATLGIGDDLAGSLFQALQARVGRWWAYQRDGKGRGYLGPMMGVHSHANPAGSRHVHWLIHIPEDIRAEFEATAANRLRKLTGVVDLRDALHFKDVETDGSTAKYIFKGIDPAYASHFFIRPANEGTVTGRRTGASRACGRAARKTAGWVRKRNVKPQA